MSWFAGLAGKAENLLNNLDEQTGAALRNHNVVRSKKHDNVQHQDPPWGQKRRQTSRPLKKQSTATETRSNNFVPTRNSSPSPSSHATSRHSRAVVKDNMEIKPSPRKKSPMRKSNTQFSLNNCPTTLVGDLKDEVDDNFGLKQRRYSYPTDLELLNLNELTYKMQNLEVENAMLKNELNVMNREVSELLDRLQRNEDELNKTQVKLNCSENQNQSHTDEMIAHKKQIEELKRKIRDLTDIEMTGLKDRYSTLEVEALQLKERNEELDNIIKQMTEKTTESNSAQIKVETELRHAQSTINELQGNLEYSKAECIRLEKDWEAYKTRVKTMLFAKDNEIKALQEGASVTEDTKNLMEQLDKLKEERESLLEAVSLTRSECSQLQRAAARKDARERALRDALKEERDARAHAEAREIAVNETLKTLQSETEDTIANLRASLREKDIEMQNLRNMSSSVPTRDTSALNVADYDETQESIDNNRIQYLTDILVQKQGKIDALLADNNILKIQLDKLESKYKTELSALRNTNHVVHLQESDRRSRSHHTSQLSTVSVKIGVIMRKYPLFRMFIIIYMICLHLWVLTVLFTSTPDGHMARQTLTV